jgi:hypothetical protein
MSCVPTSAKYFKVNITSFCDAQKSASFLSEAANPATKFIQTLLNRFYAQNPDEIPTKNTTKQRLSLFEVPVVPPPIPEKRKLPNETCVKEKRRKVVTKGKKPVPDEQLEEPSTPSTRNNPSSVDLNSTITRCIQTGLQALKSELRAELREEMKQESKAGLQLVHENSKQLHILTSKFQQEMADLLKSRDEKFSAQLKILTELKTPPVSEVKPDLCQRGTKTQKKMKTKVPEVEADAQSQSPPPVETPSVSVPEKKELDCKTQYLEKIVELQEKLLQQTPTAVHPPVRIDTPTAAPTTQPVFATPFQSDPQLQIAPTFAHFAGAGSTGQPIFATPSASIIQPSFLSTTPQYSVLPDGSNPRLIGAETKAPPNVQALLAALQKAIYQ